MLAALNRPVARIKAIKSGEGTGNYTGNLDPLLLLSKGCKVMLLRNLWTAKGLVNGAIGTVFDIIYNPEQSPPDLPTAVLVEFPDYNGPSVVFGRKVVPITPRTETWQDDHGKFHSIAQIPLRVAYSMSIHKSQSLTLLNIIIDIGNREFSTGLSFVGFSRDRTIEDIAIESAFDYERLAKIGKTHTMELIRAEENRLINLYNIRKNG